MILWDEEHIDEEELNPTKQILTKRLYNPLVHVNGAWREDLRHLILAFLGQNINMYNYLDL